MLFRSYYHNPFKNCPNEPRWLSVEKCNCDPDDSISKLFAFFINISIRVREGKRINVIIR